MKALVKDLRAAPQRPTDLSKPEFDALTPEDSDIVIETISNDMVKAKFQNRLEYKLLLESGNVQDVTYR